MVKAGLGMRIAQLRTHLHPSQQRGRKYLFLEETGTRRQSAACVINGKP
jgi:hypothetical protein